MLLKKLQLATVTILLSSACLAGCTSTHTRESTGQFIDSTAITTKVKARLIADKNVKSLPITVKTYKHTVQLSGFVESDYQKRLAVAIAADVPGVEAVQDALIIRNH